MKKRILAMLLATSMVLASLAACGGGAASEAAPAAEEEAEAPAEEEAEAPAEEEAEAPAEEEAEAPAATNPSEKMTLTWLHHFAEQGIVNWIDERIAKFNETHDNVEIVQEFIPSDQFSQMLSTRFATDDAPAFFDPPSGRRELHTFVEEGLCADLSDLDYSAVNADLCKDGQIDGIQYGLVVDANAYGYFYDIDLLESRGLEIPKTATEFNAICDQLMAEGIQPIATGFGEMWVMNSMISCYVQQMCGLDVWVRKEGGEKWEGDEKFYEAMDNFMATKKYWGDDPFGGNNDSAKAAVANGEAAFYANGTWTIDGIESLNPDMEVGFFAVPVSDNPDENKAVYAPGNPFCCYATDDPEQLAIEKEFFQTLISDEGCNAYATIAKKFSAGTSVDFSFNKGLQMTADIPNEQRLTKGGDDTLSLRSELGTIFQETCQEWIAKDDYTSEGLAKALDEAFAMAG